MKRLLVVLMLMLAGCSAPSVVIKVDGMMKEQGGKT